MDPEVTDIYPSIGAVGGGTSVTLFGNNFFNTTENICKFGTLPIFGMSVFWSTTKLECVSPANNVSFVPVEMSLNSFEFTNNNTMFQYIRTSTFFLIERIVTYMVLVCSSTWHHKHRPSEGTCLWRYRCYGVRV